VTDDKLKSLAERIERLMDERDGLGADIRDIFTEAKSAGYVPKVLRKAITRKRMDPSKRDEEDAILELYEGALGAVGKALAAVRAGATWKEASADHGVPRATLARAVKVSKRREELRTDTDPATGEITPTHEMGAEHAPQVPAREEAGNTGGDHDRGLDDGEPAASGAYSECPPAITIPTREGEREGDDPNPLPSFLRRVVVAPASPAQLDERVEGAAQ
jgi:uncharacterized protein (UPF0335 family)